LQFGDGLCGDNSNHVAGEARPAWWWVRTSSAWREPLVSNL
jgi:hypothetical protein